MSVYSGSSKLMLPQFHFLNHNYLLWLHQPINQVVERSCCEEETTGEPMNEQQEELSRSGSPCGSKATIL